MFLSDWGVYESLKKQAMSSYTSSPSDQRRPVVIVNSSLVPHQTEILGRS